MDTKIPIAEGNFLFQTIRFKGQPFVLAAVSYQILRICKGHFMLPTQNYALLEGKPLKNTIHLLLG